jgi:Asp/Glu/hydantoin racemase
MLRTREASQKAETMPRLAVLHTVSALAERFKPMFREKLRDSVDTFHMVDESLLQDLMRHGPQPGITRRVVTFAELAADAGADLIVFTCSSTSPAIDVARQTIAVPILKIDDPMAARAAQLGKRIGVVCTTNSTKGPSADLVRAHAREQKREVEVEALLVDGAFQALSSGNRDEHDRLVREAAMELAKRSDVVVLAQASMAHLEEPIKSAVPIPVLASPRLCVEAVAARLS